MSKTSSQVTTLDSKPTAKASTDAAPAAIEVKGSSHDAALSGERITITVHPGNDQLGSEAVFVSVNGYAYQIPRGVPCSVPVEVAEVLDNAQVTHYQAALAGGVTERVANRFQYNVAR